MQNQFAAKQAVRDFVFAKDGASFATPENEQAAAKLQEWAEKGYFTPDFNGTGYDPAWQQFAKGKGRFLIAGTWLTADLADNMGDKVGFMLMPPEEEGGDPVSLGGESLPFAVTNKSANPDVAAAYIDFLTNAEAGQVLVDTNNLPAMKTDAAPAGGVAADVDEAWKTLNEADGFVPYIDYATPTFYDDISGAIQKLLGGKMQPARLHGRRQAGLHEVHGVALVAAPAASLPAPAARRRARVGERPPGEPRRVAYLYILPGLAVFVAVRAAAADPQRLDLAVRLGRRDARGVGRPGQLQGGRDRSRRCARPSCTRWSC